MSSSRPVIEIAPRAFEAALYYATAVTDGGFGQVIKHDRAVGVPVRSVPGCEIPEHVRAGLEALARRPFTVLQARARTATFRNDQGRHSRVETFALLDSVVAGTGWFVAARLSWPWSDFDESAETRAHDRIVVAAEVAEAAENGNAVDLVRLRFDDVEGAALRTVVRETLLRSLVLWPAFGVTPLPRVSRG